MSIQLEGFLQKIVRFLVTAQASHEDAQVTQYRCVGGIDLPSGLQRFFRLRAAVHTEIGTAEGLPGEVVFRVPREVVPQCSECFLVAAALRVGDPDREDSRKVVGLFHQYTRESLYRLIVFPGPDQCLGLLQDLLNLHAVKVRTNGGRVKFRAIVRGRREAYNRETMISILLIGDEILSASIREGNLHHMLTGFAEIGYPVREVRIVRDDTGEIAAAMRELRDRSDYLVTAGGIGPTHDDRTLEAAAVAFHREVETHQEMLAFLRSRYGEPLTPMVAKMAQLPRGTQVIGAQQGCWPVIRWENVFILPGLPRALRDKMGRVLAMIPRRENPWNAEIYLTADESLFADWLQERQAGLAGVVIGSYPVAGDYDYRSRITIRGSSRAAVVEEGQVIAEFARARGWLVRVGGVLHQG